MVYRTFILRPGRCESALLCTFAAPRKHYPNMLCVDLYVYVDMQGLICIRPGHCHSTYNLHQIPTPFYFSDK